MAQRKEISEYILGRAYILFTKHWFCFLRIAAVFFIPLLILNKYFWQNQTLVNKIISKSSLIAFVVIDDIINFTVGIFFLLYLAALSKAIHAADNGEKPGAVASYRRALNIFGSYLLVKILFLFKVLCWSLLFIIPGAVAGFFYSFSGMALIVDCKRGKEALVFSKNIIKPNTKKYFLHLLGTTSFLLIVCAAAILSLDILLVFYRISGKFFLASAIDYFEVGLVAVIGIFWLIFYYYLYKEIRGDAQAL